MSKERAFIENWWKRKFSMPNLSTGDDVIMVSHALELLKAFRGAGDAKWIVFSRPGGCANSRATLLSGAAS